MNKIKQELMLKQLINLCIETTDAASRMSIADKRSGKDINEITYSLIKAHVLRYGIKTPEMVCFENMKEILDRLLEINEH